MCFSSELNSLCASANEEFDSQLLWPTTPLSQFFHLPTPTTGDTRGDGMQSAHSSKQRRHADGPDSVQSLEAQQSQFTDEAVEFPVSAQRQTGVRRSSRFLSCSTLTRRSISPLRAQETVRMPQVHSTEKLVDDTVLMRTGSGSPSSTANSEHSSDSGTGNSSEWWTLQLCNRQSRSFLW